MLRVAMPSFRGEPVPLDMEGVVIVPLKAGNDHRPIVAVCIYKTPPGKGTHEPDGHLARNPSYDQIHYTEGVLAFRKDTAVGAEGDLRLEGLLFEPGQPVEVLVISKAAGPAADAGRSLLDSVVEYRDPLEPVASEDWDAPQ
jgi:hypothetical protein